MCESHASSTSDFVPVNHQVEQGCVLYFRSRLYVMAVTYGREWGNEKKWTTVHFVVLAAFRVIRIPAVDQDMIPDDLAVAFDNGGEGPLGA